MKIMTRNPEDVERLREHYDTHSTAGELDSATYDPGVQDQPMVTYAMRLPKPVLDQLREAAADRGVRVSALMRQWLEERLTREADVSTDDDAVRVTDLLAFIAERRIQQQPQQDSRKRA